MFLIFVQVKYSIFMQQTLLAANIFGSYLFVQAKLKTTLFFKVECSCLFKKIKKYTNKIKIFSKQATSFSQLISSVTYKKPYREKIKLFCTHLLLSWMKGRLSCTLLNRMITITRSSYRAVPVSMHQVQQVLNKKNIKSFEWNLGSICCRLGILVTCPNCRYREYEHVVGWLVGRLDVVCVFYNIQSVVTALIRRTTLSQGHFWKHLVVAFLLYPYTICMERQISCLLC